VVARPRSTHRRSMTYSGSDRYSRIHRYSQPSARSPKYQCHGSAVCLFIPCDIALSVCSGSSRLTKKFVNADSELGCTLAVRTDSTGELLTMSTHCCPRRGIFVGSSSGPMDGNDSIPRPKTRRTAQMVYGCELSTPTWSRK
jgi:hypothetical protein